jgi:hypothetical protein
MNMAGLAQPLLKDGRPDRVLVDDDDFEGGIHLDQTSSNVPSLAGTKLLSKFQVVMVECQADQQREAGAAMPDFGARRTHFVQRKYFPSRQAVSGAVQAISAGPAGRGLGQ